ncbi:MAG TPA: oxygen-dependent coproporphyrinogen oxidase [Chitinophagales bacterium]|nr:oxygen-dependent coproporphyrinogen oxidase [Chitinophagales bacterium]
MMTIDTISSWFKELQNNITESLSAVDGLGTFQSDLWERAEGGGGDTRIILNGNVFEKGGVNFSHVHGKLPEVLKSETRTADFFHATGVSIVIHPNHPMVPIIHMNVRYFEMRDHQNGNVVDAWFGGGIDLSPAYPNEEDVLFFHQYLKDACDRHDMTYYAKFKKWCDEYFTIVHRHQMRGVGGVFFDHMRGDEEKSMEDIFAFVQDIGNAFVPIYTEVVERNRSKSFGDTNKKWQLMRRGYYTEFNLVYDKGTHFGLKSNGRIESILMSLPPQAEWVYNFVPEEKSAEFESLAYFQPRDWKLAH